jgi:hypothetical protein
MKNPETQQKNFILLKFEGEKQKFWLTFYMWFTGVSVNDKRLIWGSVISKRLIWGSVFAKRLTWGSIIA